MPFSKFVYSTISLASLIVPVPKLIVYRKSNEGYITAFRFLSHISVHGGHVCSRMSFRAIAVSLPEVFHAGIGYFSALGAWRTTAPLAFSRPHERMIHLRGRCLTLFPRRLLDEMINPCSMSRQDILREPANPACVSWPWRLFPLFRMCLRAFIKGVLSLRTEEFFQQTVAQPRLTMVIA